MADSMSAVIDLDSIHVGGTMQSLNQLIRLSAADVNQVPW